MICKLILKRLANFIPRLIFIIEMQGVGFTFAQPNNGAFVGMQGNHGATSIPEVTQKVFLHVLIKWSLDMIRDSIAALSLLVTLYGLLWLPYLLT